MVFSWICRRHGKPASIHRVQPSYRAGQDAGATDGRRVGRGARAGGLNAITQAGWCPVAASRRLPGRPGLVGVYSSFERQMAENTPRMAFGLKLDGQLADAVANKDGICPAQ